MDEPRAPGKSATIAAWALIAGTTFVVAACDVPPSARGPWEAGDGGLEVADGDLDPPGDEPSEDDDLGTSAEALVVPAGSMQCTGGTPGQIPSTCTWDLSAVTPEVRGGICRPGVPDIVGNPNRAWRRHGGRSAQALFTSVRRLRGGRSQFIPDPVYAEWLEFPRQWGAACGGGRPACPGGQTCGRRGSEQRCFQYVLEDENARVAPPVLNRRRQRIRSLFARIDTALDYIYGRSSPIQSIAGSVLTEGGARIVALRDRPRAPSLYAVRSTNDLEGYAPIDIGPTIPRQLAYYGWRVVEWAVARPGEDLATRGGPIRLLVEYPVIVRQALHPGAPFPNTVAELDWHSLDWTRPGRVWLSMNHYRDAILLEPHRPGDYGFEPRGGGRCFYRPTEAHCQLRPETVFDDIYHWESASPLFSPFGRVQWIPPLPSGRHYQVSFSAMERENGLGIVPPFTVSLTQLNATGLRSVWPPEVNPPPRFLGYSDGTVATVRTNDAAYGGRILPGYIMASAHSSDVPASLGIAARGRFATTPAECGVPIACAGAIGADCARPLNLGASDGDQGLCRLAPGATLARCSASVGSFAHDECCIDHPDGVNCGPEATSPSTLCQQHWDDAVRDFFGRRWPVQYDPVAWEFPLTRQRLATVSSDASYSIIGNATLLRRAGLAAPDGQTISADRAPLPSQFCASATAVVNWETAVCGGESNGYVPNPGVSLDAPGCGLNGRPEDFVFYRWSCPSQEETGIVWRTIDSFVPPRPLGPLATFRICGGCGPDTASATSTGGTSTGGCQFVGVAPPTYCD